MEKDKIGQRSYIVFEERSVLGLTRVFNTAFKTLFALLSESVQQRFHNVALLLALVLHR